MKFYEKKTDHLISARRPDQVVKKGKKKRISCHVDFTVSVNWVRKKESYTKDFIISSGNTIKTDIIRHYSLPKSTALNLCNQDKLILFENTFAI